MRPCYRDAVGDLQPTFSPKPLNRRVKRAMSKPQPAISPAPMYVPVTPLKADNTGLDFGFLADLALKTVYADANCTTERAASKLKLSMPVTEEFLQPPYREKFIEIRGLVSYGNNRYGMLDRGWQRAEHLLEMNGYIGPAPVSLSAYTEMVVRQSAARDPVEPEAVRSAMAELVLP